MENGLTAQQNVNRSHVAVLAEIIADRNPSNENIRKESEPQPVVILRAALREPGAFGARTGARAKKRRFSGPSGKGRG